MGTSCIGLPEIHVLYWRTDEDIMPLFPPRGVTPGASMVSPPLRRVCSSSDVCGMHSKTKRQHTWNHENPSLYSCMIRHPSHHGLSVRLVSSISRLSNCTGKGSSRSLGGHIQIPSMRILKTRVATVGLRTSALAQKRYRQRGFHPYSERKPACCMPWSLNHASADRFFRGA